MKSRDAEEATLDSGSDSDSETETIKRTLRVEAERDNFELILTQEEIEQFYGVTLFDVSGDGPCFLHALNMFYLFETGQRVAMELLVSRINNFFSVNEDIIETSYNPEPWRIYKRARPHKIWFFYSKYLHALDAYVYMSVQLCFCMKVVVFISYLVLCVYFVALKFFIFMNLFRYEL